MIRTASSVHVCFYCVDSFENLEKAVYFRLPGGIGTYRLWLHAKCAKKLAGKLLADAEEILPTPGIRSNMMAKAETEEDWA